MPTCVGFYKDVDGEPADQMPTCVGLKKKKAKSVRSQIATSTGFKDEVDRGRLKSESHLRWVSRRG